MLIVFSIIAVCAVLGTAVMLIMWLRDRGSGRRKKALICLAIALVALFGILSCDDGDDNESADVQQTHVTYAPVESTPTPAVQTPTPEPTAASAAANDSGTGSSSAASSGSTGIDQIDGKYVASKSSNKYHYPSCGSAGNILKENQIWFSSADEAATQGYSPCGRCKP